MWCLCWQVTQKQTYFPEIPLFSSQIPCVCAYVCACVCTFVLLFTPPPPPPCLLPIQLVFGRRGAGACEKQKWSQKHRLLPIIHTCLKTSGYFNFTLMLEVFFCWQFSDFLKIMPETVKKIKRFHAEKNRMHEICIVIININKLLSK